MLALKGNQSELEEMVSDFFTTAIQNDFSFVEHSRAEDNDYGHGRIESRICYALTLANYLKDYREEWADLKSLVCIISARQINSVIQQKTRYYISSLEANAAKISHAIRCHWHKEQTRSSCRKHEYHAPSCIELDKKSQSL